MQAKVLEKKKAVELRRSGHSLNEISELLGVSKASASLWVGRMELSEDAQMRIEQRRKEARERAAMTNRGHVDKKFQEAAAYGKRVVSNGTLNPDAARVVCAVMYWCEGTKIRRSEVLGFTNSDPLVIASFLKLLREGFIVDEQKLRVTAHLHDYHDADTQLRFWSKVTKIPLTQFHRPYRKPHTAKRTREGYQGCVSVRYLDVDFGRRLEGIAQAFLKGP
ncbi:MAG: hypothetical protein Q7S95_00485 [bacterium]|nr:hypothetical protein [bacterium]